MKSATHQGHCQACGRIQFLPNDVLAKHGYVVKGFGFFNGVCAGSGKKPIEVDRAVLDDICVQLDAHANSAEGRAKAYRDGVMTPELVYAREPWGDVKRKYVNRDRVPVEISWADANAMERTQGLDLVISQNESEARQARDWIKMLQDLATKVHGQPLQPVPVVVPPRNFSVGEEVTLKSGLTIKLTSVYETRGWNRRIAGWRYTRADVGTARQFSISIATLRREAT